MIRSPDSRTTTFTRKVIYYVLLHLTTEITIHASSFNLLSQSELLNYIFSVKLPLPWDYFRFVLHTIARLFPTLWIVQNAWDYCVQKYRWSWLRYTSLFNSFNDFIVTYIARFTILKPFHYIILSIILIASYILQTY